MRSTQRHYLTTIVVFGAASLAVLVFLIFRPSDRISYELPQLEPLDRSAITKIAIDRSGGLVTLSRQGGRWLVSPGDYVADQTAIDVVLDTLTEFNVTEVVSFADEPNRYDLDDENRVQVTVKGNDGNLLAFDVGSRAGTFGHTFVRVPGDDRILQGVGDLRNVFDRDLDVYRDKSVLVFDPATITEIGVTRMLPPEAPRSVRVTRSLAGWDYIEGEEAAASGQGPLDPAGIESALQFMGTLSAYRYGDDPVGMPWLTMTLEGEKTYTLELYPEQASVYPAKSSESEFFFDMLLFQAGLISEPFGFE